MAEAADRVGAAGTGATTPAPPGGRHLLSLGGGLGVLAVVLSVGLLALLGYGLLRQQAGASAGPGVNAVGQVVQVRARPAPDFALELFGGGEFRLAEQRGRVVLVNFWASWCPPCRDEAPALEAAWRAHRDAGVVLVGVDVWDKEADARSFLREFRVTYPNGSSLGGSTPIDYGVRGIPETFVVDRQGQLVRKWIGPLTEAQVAALIEGLAP